MEQNRIDRKLRGGGAARAKKLGSELIAALLPAAGFGILTALILGAPNSRVIISLMLTGLFGAGLDSLEQFNILMSLFFFAPPLLQLVFLGDRIPRELSGGVYSLTRAKGREGWFVKKLLWLIVLSLLMSLFMLLPIHIFARMGGAAADELLPTAYLELMATWGLCHCMIVVFSNIIGMLVRPLYLLMISLVLYAVGLVLSIEGGAAAKLFPTVQGILYAHNSIFGKTQEGFFTPIFSAAYQGAVIAALGIFGVLHIRKTDIL